MTNMASDDTSREKFPSISVIVPFVVPFSTTLAPAIAPKASSTVPLTSRLAACWGSTPTATSEEVATVGAAKDSPVETRNMEVPNINAVGTG